ncbi:MAG: acyl carrier protein [Chloroflexi bacterium]|nr:acyl carrier protein [Chloroflexota bacterium]
MSDKVFSIVSKVFSISLDKITDESNPETIDSWDSFNGLILVDELENTFNVKFSITEITDVKTISDIKRHLKNHGINIDE